MAVDFERQIAEGILLGITIPAAATEVDLIPSRGAGKNVRIVRSNLFTDAGGDLQLIQSGDSAVISGVQAPPAAGVWEIEPEDEYKTTIADRAIRVTRSASIGIKGEIVIVEGPNP